MQRRTFHFFWVVLVILPLPVFAQQDPVPLQSWKDQKYSMFIHWGIYSVLGGVWKDKNVSIGLSEQIQAHAGIYSDTYAHVARRFDPLKWNADSVVQLAKNAGMRSIIITSKHHDGFCMFKTTTTDFNVVDATPYKRDVLKELSDACARGGLRFGLYFSLIDWHYPEASPISSHNSDLITPAHHEYNKKQLAELLSNYGKISELWFDMGSQSITYSRELRDLVHRLQPHCMIGSRIGNDMGDFTVMGDNQEPDYIIGVPWQSPASFFHETWGYRSWQNRTDIKEKIKEKLTSLIKVVSRGGNYLLNIGPRGDGTIVEYERAVLLQIGDWLHKNEEAIYGTQPDPFHVSFNWGHVTQRDDRIYLLLNQVPENGTVFLPGLKGTIRDVYTLDDKEKKGASKKSAAGITITLPKNLTITENWKVVVVQLHKGYSVLPPNIISFKDSIETGSFNGFKYYSNSGIDYNSRYQSTIKESWTLQPQQKSSFVPVLYYTEEEKGKTIGLEINNNLEKILLDNDPPVSISNNTASVKWGDFYLNGPFWSGIDGTNGRIDSIDISKPWPRNNSSSWIKKTEWKDRTSYSLPADMTSAWYILREAESEQDQNILIRITSGDGLFVALNGKKIFIGNNPAKAPAKHHTILLHLKKGKNQLLLKLYNNFQKAIPFSLDNTIPQTVYFKKLNTIALEKAKLYPVSWVLDKPVTPHEDLGLPNLRLRFVKGK